MGLLYISASLRRAGHEPRVFDALDHPDAPQRFAALLDEQKPHVIGLSGITFDAPALRQLAEIATTVAPGVPVVVGGAHASAYPRACLGLPGVTHVVQGEGEAVFPRLVEALTDGDGAQVALPGVLAASTDGDSCEARPPEPIRDLDDLPFPDWAAIDPAEYARRKGMAIVGIRPYMGLVTSRGCPFACIYCHGSHGRRFRARSPENVLAEMREIHDRLGLADLEIYDDVFNFDRERCLRLLEGVARLPWKTRLHFPNGLRADRLDAELVALLRRAGTRYVAVALESATPRLQRLMGKRLDLDEAARAIERLADARIFTLGYFMLGFPTETLDEARQTIRYAAASRLHSAMFFAVTPYAGTPLYERFVAADGGHDHDAERHFFEPSCNLSAMSDAELRQVHRAAWRRFYANPLRLARLLATHPDLGYLVTYSGPYALRRLLHRSEPTRADAPPPGFHLDARETPRPR